MDSSQSAATCRGSRMSLAPTNFACGYSSEESNMQSNPGRPRRALAQNSSASVPRYSNAFFGPGATYGIIKIEHLFLVRFALAAMVTYCKMPAFGVGFQQQTWGPISSNSFG